MVAKLHIDMKELPEDVPIPPKEWVIENIIAPMIKDMIAEDARQQLSPAN